MILFKPVGRPPEVFNFNGTLMSQPLTSNPNALNSPKVYFIFVGPNWEQNGNPSAAVNSMIAAAKAILNSSYLSQLKQYGSDGNATFGDFTIDTSLDPLTWSKDYRLSNGTIDHTNNPMWFETDQILSNSNFSSWNPPAGDARNSPIYVVVRYSHDGTGAGAGAGGSNANGPNDYTSRAVNVIDVAINAADQVDQFSWVFSHEIVERMSTGIRGLSEVSPDIGGQIADGEPEIAFYSLRLNGSSGPVVTSYWSVLHQAFIIPDGNLNTVLLVPVWNSNSWTGKCLSLQQGNLYEITPTYTTTLIDSQVQSYAINLRGGASQIFDLTAKGQVKQYSGSGTAWTGVTGAPTVASCLVSTSHLVFIGRDNNGNPMYGNSDGELYMLASNDSGKTSPVWRYTGSGTTWTQVTGPNTTVVVLYEPKYAIAAVAGSIYMLASNDNGNTSHVWQYTGSGVIWAKATGSPTRVYAIAGVAGGLYMLANNDGSTGQAWQYNGTPLSWSPLTDTNIMIVDQIAVSGDELYIVAGENGSIVVSQYGLIPNSWIPLTGPETNADKIVGVDGIGLCMKATNDNGMTNPVWQYKGTPLDWKQLTGRNTIVDQIFVATDDRLHMFAANVPEPSHNWVYNGAPLDWTIV